MMDSDTGPLGRAATGSHVDPRAATAGAASAGAAAAPAAAAAADLSDSPDFRPATDLVPGYPSPSSESGGRGPAPLPGARTDEAAQALFVAYSFVGAGDVVRPLAEWPGGGREGRPAVVGACSGLAGLGRRRLLG